MHDDSDRDSLREQALLRLKKKRDFAAHAMAYVAVNGFLVVIWATVANGGFFWPIFPIFGWGIGLFFHAWDVYKGEPTEDEIAREIERIPPTPSLTGVSVTVFRGALAVPTSALCARHDR